MTIYTQITLELFTYIKAEMWLNTRCLERIAGMWQLFQIRRRWNDRADYVKNIFRSPSYLVWSSQRPWRVSWYLCAENDCKGQTDFLSLFFLWQEFACKLQKRKGCWFFPFLPRCRLRRRRAPTGWSQSERRNGVRNRSLKSVRSGSLARRSKEISGTRQPLE